MFRRASDKEHDRIYAVGALLAIAALWSIPLFLSAVEMQGPPAVRAVAAADRLILTALGGTLSFHDATAQSREFIGYHHTIELTPEQEAIKKEVLGAMPAACCSGSTAYTCCCPCNLSKTIWGLSNYVIARRGADVMQLREAVDSWMAFVNPDGFRGNACYRGGCESLISAGGCGAMSEEKLSV